MVAPDKKFFIALNNNYSTGYHWEILEVDESIVQLERKYFQPDEPVTVGSGGADQWVFRALSPGSTKIIFGHYPPSAQPVEPENYAAFLVIVK